MIRYTAQAIDLMGRAWTPLRPTMSSFTEGVDSGDPLMVVAERTALARTGLRPPVAPGGGNAVTVNGDPVTAVDLNAALGVIQAFTDRGRAVLAIDASGDWSLVDRSFDFIRAQDDAWSSLSADVVATGAENVTVNLTVREGGTMPHRPSPDEGWSWWAWVTVGVAAVAVSAVSTILLLRRRRRGTG